MGKLNKKQTDAEKILSRTDITLNEEGGIAFRPDAKMELVLRTVSSLVSEDGFYKSGKELDRELRESIHSVISIDPEFVLKLALYSRNKMYLRTAPVVLIGEFAMSAGRGKVVGSRKYIAQTIQRADEITELIAYVMAQNKTRKVFSGKIPTVIKHGVSSAFNKFGAYHLAKYDRKGEVTIRDAMFMTHPKPKDEEQERVFKALANNVLESPETWEVMISTKGSTKENWETIFPKMGYMAVLRNLRNFLEKGVDMGPVIKKLSSPEEVVNSKQFPYRFVSAYKEIEGTHRSGKVLDALSDAANMSVQNVPVFKGKTFVTCDTSGSMGGNISSKSKMTMKEVGCLFGAIVHAKSEDAIVSVFATEHVPVNISARDSLFTNTKKMLSQNTRGWGTDAYKVMDWLVDNKVFVDRIVLFSDMQCYSGDAKMFGHINSHDNIYLGLQKYRKKVNPNVYVYSFDLAHYGTTQFPQEDQRVCLAGGFSDKILNFIPMFERSRADMLSEIEAIRL